MANKTLAKEEFVKLFADLNSVLSAKPSRSGEATPQNVTIRDLLKRHNIELTLPPEMQERLGPALDGNLSGPPALRSSICSACSACAACAFCAEVNYTAGAIGLGGLAGLA